MKKVLFVCGGNTCRSPMAKVILEQMLKEQGLENEILVDSAAKGSSTHSTATENAREAIKQLYGKDLLANHRSKSINNVNLSGFQLILTMEKGHKNSLPKDKTYTLKEYAGLSGNISDPYNKSLQVYRERRDEVKNCLQRALEKIIHDS